MQMIVKTLMTVAGLCVLSAGSVALADGPAAVKNRVTNADRTSEINKQVGFIDLYLTQAINDAKLLSTFGDATRGASDATIVTEAHRELDGAIDKGLGHLAKLRGWKTDLAIAPGSSSSDGASARSADPAPAVDPLAELEHHLREARTASAKLGTIPASELSGAVDRVAAHLMGADAAFRGIAKWTNYTRLQSTNLSTVPVRGDTMPPGSGIERDLDRSKPAPSPAERGPQSREPIQAAPGTGSPAAAKPNP